MNARPAVVVLICSVAMLSGCGQKGDPLPPLVRVPVAPADFAAERRGAHADLHFTVPATNTDGTRPANIARVEIYALTGSPTVADDALLKLGTKVAIRNGRGYRGQIVIEYFDRAGLDRLCAKLAPIRPIA